jgi:hypothetical protein
MVFEKILFLISQSKQELPMAAILVAWLAQNMEILYRIFHTSFLQSNNSLFFLVLEEKNFFNFSQSETRIAHGDHVFVKSGQNEKIL